MSEKGPPPSSSSSSSTSSATKAKEEGNAAFAKGDIRSAIEAYSRGLLQLAASSAESPTQDERLLLAALHSNRALSFAKAGQLESCEEDCSRALELEPGRVKMLYKRAQCLEQRGELKGALEDLALALKLEPGNRQAAALATSVRDQLGTRSDRMTPLRKALEDLSDSNSDSGAADKRIRALHGIAAMVAQDRGQALALIREGSVDLVASRCAKPNLSLAERASALRVLTGCCQHEKFASYLIKRVAADKKVAAAGESCCPLSLSDLIKVNILGDQDEEIASPCVGFLSALSSHDEVLVRGIPESADAGAVREILSPFFSALADAWAAAASSSSPSVRDIGMEAAARWCRDDLMGTSLSASGERDSNGMASLSASQRAENYKLKEKKSWMARDKGLMALEKMVKPLFVMLSSDQKGGNERRKACATLTCLIKPLCDVLASTEAREKDLESLKHIFGPYLNFAPPGELPPAASDFDPSASRLASSIRKVSAATALAQAGGSFGSWAMGKEHCVAEIMTLTMTGDMAAHETAAEAICACASFDGGRPLLAPVVESGVIFALMESSSPQARSAAASGYAKLGMISQALKGDSADITKLLNVSLDLIGSSREPVEKERAVEVLTFLVNKTAVKEELTHGSARCKASLPSLCEAAQTTDGRSALSYGLATVFASLTITQEEATKEAFKDKDVTYEQYEKLQEIAESHGQGPKPDPLDRDSTEAAYRRCGKLVEAGGVQALRALASTSASPATLDAVARCFRNVACVEGTRGGLVAQGGLSCLTALASKAGGHEMKMNSRHAIAKILVTTNPNLLSEASMLDCVPPLMELVKSNESTNLQQFEALLALTNVSSTGHSARRCIADKKGVSAIHYLMFSDHELVRRAATETLTNMLPHESVLELMSSHEPARLWVAFAGIADEDEPTALAASGAIASASQDERVAAALLQAGVVSALEGLVASGSLPFVHRVAVAVFHLAQSPDGSQKISDSKLPALLGKVAKSCDAKEVGGAAEKALSALREHQAAGGPSTEKQ